MDIGGRIRTVRKAAGLTQEELARRADMSLKGMGDIERGAIPDPHYSSLSKIAAALNVPIGALLESEAPKVQSRFQSEPADEERLDEERLSRDTASIGRQRRTIRVEPLPKETPQRQPERSGQTIAKFLSYEEPFGELPAEERVERLERWREHFQSLGDRRYLDVSEGHGVRAYGRGLEMYALDEVERQRYFAEGVHTHIERVTRGELEVSEEEWGLCLRVNKAIARAQNLTNEVRELVQDTSEREAQQSVERFLEASRSETRYG